MEIPEVLQPVLTAFLTAAGTLLLSLLTYLATRATKFVVDKRDELVVRIGYEKMQLLIQWAGLAVKTVEQLVETNRLPNVPEVMLNKAKEFVRRFAARIGIDVDDEQLLIIIESAIRDGVHKGIGLIDIAFTPEGSDDEDPDVGTLPPRASR